MSTYQWITLALAIAAGACIVAIGVFIAEESAIGIIASIIGTILFMGAGFRYKKKHLG